MLSVLWSGPLVPPGLDFGAIFGSLAVTLVPWERLVWRLDALLPPLLAHPLSHAVFHEFFHASGLPGGGSAAPGRTSGTVVISHFAT